MNKIVAVAFSFATAAAAFSPAFAQTAPAPGPSLAAATAGPDARIAPASGAEERDVGIAGYSGGGACLPIYSAYPTQVGPVTGESEKDTVARTVVETECH